MFHEGISYKGRHGGTHSCSFYMFVASTFVGNQVDDVHILMRLRVSTSTSLEIKLRVLGTRIFVKWETT